MLITLATRNASDFEEVETEYRAIKQSKLRY